MSRLERGYVEHVLVESRVEQFMDALRAEIEAPLRLRLRGGEFDFRNSGRGFGRHNVLRRWLLDEPGLTEGDISNAQGLLAEMMVKDVLARVLPSTTAVRLSPYDLANPQNHGGRAGDLLLGRYVVAENGHVSDIMEPLVQIDVTISGKRYKILRKRGPNRHALGMPVVVLPLAGLQYKLTDGEPCDVRSYIGSLKPLIRSGNYPDNQDVYHRTFSFAAALVHKLQEETSAVSAKFVKRQGVFSHEERMLRALEKAQAILGRANYSANMLQSC